MESGVLGTPGTIFILPWAIGPQDHGDLNNMVLLFVTRTISLEAQIIL